MNEPEHRIDLVIVGSYNLDIGIALDRFPAPGETVFANDLIHSHGGKGSNQAVQASRCGASTAILAAIGDDSAGRQAQALWAAESVHAGCTVVRTDRPTGTAFIAIDAHGENQIVVVPGANATLMPADVCASGAIVANARVVLAQLEVPLDAVIESFRLGRQGGATTMLNAAPARSRLPAELLSLTDFLIVNEIEAAMIDPDQRARVAQGVVTTLGADGAQIALAGAAPVHLNAPEVRVVDTTGAGDAFAGCFAAHWLQYRDPVAAVQAGIVAGSQACGARGAVPSFGRFQHGAITPPRGSSPANSSDRKA